MDVDIHDVVQAILNEYASICKELERTRGYLREKSAKVSEQFETIQRLHQSGRDLKTKLDIANDYCSRLETILKEDHGYTDNEFTMMFEKSERVYGGESDDIDDD